MLLFFLHPLIFLFISRKETTWNIHVLFVQLKWVKYYDGYLVLALVNSTFNSVIEPGVFSGIASVWKKYFKNAFH